MYLNREGDEYKLGICNRFISSNEERAKREISVITQLSKGDYEGLWLDNDELREEHKAMPLMDIDSLIATQNLNIQYLKGHPVVITQAIIDESGQLITSSDPVKNKFIITDQNGFHVQSLRKAKVSELSLAIGDLSSQVVRWKPAVINSQRVQSVVSIRWEVIEDTISYEIL